MNPKKTKTSFWKKIFGLAKIITNKEAEEIKKAIINIRKEYGFRK